MRTDDLQGAVWLPGDGKANPADLTQALAKGARNRGVKIFEGVRVTGRRSTRDGRRRVRALDWQDKQGRAARSRPTSSCICGGQWARQLGRRMVGVTVPLYLLRAHVHRHRRRFRACSATCR